MFAVLSVGTFVGSMANAGRVDVNEHYLVVAATALGVVMLVMSVLPGEASAFGALAVAASRPPCSTPPVIRCCNAPPAVTTTVG